MVPLVLLVFPHHYLREPIALAGVFLPLRDISHTTPFIFIFQSTKVKSGPLHSVFITSNKLMIQFCYTHYVNYPTLNGSSVKWKRGVFVCFPSQHLPTPIYFCFAVFLSITIFIHFVITLLLNPCEQKKLRHVEIRKKVYQSIWRVQLSTSLVVVP